MSDENALSEAELEALEDHLANLETCLIEGDLEGARASLSAARDLAGDDDPDVSYGRALIAWEQGDLDLAVRELREVLEVDPEFADAHHTLGLVLEELGDEPGKVHHFMRTRVLDAKQDQEVALAIRAEAERIERVAREVLDRLPDEFADKLRNVPVMLENRPSRSLVEEGFDPRSFGLFEGPPHGDDAPAPTRIVLYTHNMLSAFGSDDLDEQVEITVLHEVGHYFGLDEDDMVRLGLD